VADEPVRDHLGHEYADQHAASPRHHARGKLYQEAAVILAQQLPSIVLFDEEGMDIATKKLNNLWTVRDSRDGWENAWLTK
jgi:peptide/nickel transport system substrate-binding protein